MSEAMIVPTDDVGEPVNYYSELAKIDVSARVEKKGNFAYLSWPWAVHHLRSVSPSAVWEVKRFDGMPYLKTDLGYFVEVAVTVEGVTLSQIHPILDQRNTPIAKPSSFQINTSLQRCLVKAIALHGLGLSVYAGEDLPDGAEQAAPERCSAAQLATLARLLNETNTDTEKFVTYFKTDVLKNLPAADYQRALKKLYATQREIAKKEAAQEAATKSGPDKSAPPTKTADQALLDAWV